MIGLVRLAKAGIPTSRLAFGTSRLHYIGHRDRERLLAAAAELGIIHFDTAPAYGDGLAESELGRFVRCERNKFIIATKYGIPADPLLEKWPDARALRITTALVRRVGLRKLQRPLLSAAGLRESAEKSLRRLKTDWIDILFLHEPRLERLASPTDILEEFGRLKRRGLIRSFGLAGAWSGVGPLLQAAPELAEIVQTSENGWPHTSPPEITYGAISQGAQKYLSKGIDSNIAVERLRSALKRRPNGVVIVSTTKADRLRLLADAAIRDTYD